MSMQEIEERKLRLESLLYLQEQRNKRRKIECLHQSPLCATKQSHLVPAGIPTSNLAGAVPNFLAEALYEPSGISSADKLFSSELKYLQAGAGIGHGARTAAEAGLAGTTGNMLSLRELQLKFSTGSNLPERSLFGNDFLFTVKYQPATLLGVPGVFANTSYPLGASSFGNLMRTREEYFEALKQQRRVDGSQILEAGSTALEMLQMSNRVGVQYGNFPLPHAKHSRKMRKPSLTSFQKQWNNIKSKEMRKELFLRRLHGDSMKISKTNPK